jgi:hypothetical protein
MSMQQRKNYVFYKILLALSVIILGVGCVSVPVEVSQLHEKELGIIKSLETSHKAIVDAYIDSRISEFETFYFNQFGPQYLENYKEAWEAKNGKKYDYEQNFSSFYPSSVAVYQEKIQPLYSLRSKLLASIDNEYSNLIISHQSIDTWLKSINDLNDADKNSINKILGSISSGLSIENIKNDVDNAIIGIKAKLLK